MAYDSFDLIFVQTLKKTLMDCECCAFAGPAEYECVGGGVRRDCDSGRGNTGFRGELADFRFKPAVLARSKIVETACESDNGWANQVLEQYYEESSD